MSPDFSIQAEWISDDRGPDELRHTSALIRMMVNDRVVTRVEDEWSKSVRSEVRLCAYPLALWFAASWWRLSCEPPPPGKTDLAWRMSHEMAAAGHGLLWPRMRFESDGQAIEISWLATEPTATEPLRYLNDAHTSVPLPVFQSGVDAFVNLVLARLDALDIRETELHTLWLEVCQERQEPESSCYRQMEARLGFDPDDAPEAAVTRLLELKPEAGASAVGEIAAACAGGAPANVLEDIIRWAHSPGIEGKIKVPGELHWAATPSAGGQEQAWLRGWKLARAAREAWGIANGPIDDRTLGEILDLDPLDFLQPSADAPAPLSLAVRHGAAGGLKFLFRKRNAPGRRFEGARFIGDYLATASGERWLPATDAGTARQKVQRAFAIEWLAPIDDLQAFLDGDFSDDTLDEAGRYFGISPLAVQSHLANNNLISRF